MAPLIIYNCKRRAARLVMAGVFQVR
jgi:hypothetical protein